MKEYKGYYIKKNKLTPQHYNVVTVGKGGKIPDILSGLFTSEKLALDSIDRYLAVKDKRKKDGQAISESGD